MKVKSLLLAGLAAFAMASCSNNDNEVIDNSNPLDGQTANMQLSFSFPQGTSKTRATDKGEESEYGFENVKLVLDYSDGQVVRTFAKADFAITNEGQTLNIKNVFAVPAGEATAYAIINPTADITTSLPDKEKNTKINFSDFEETFASATLDGIAGKVATANKFLMSNVNGAGITVNLLSGKTSSVSIPVERVAAKFDEVTTLGRTDITNYQPVSTGESIAVTIANYSYGNMVNKTFLFGNKPNVAEFFQPYVGGAITTGTYEYKTINTGAANVTYALENTRAKDVTDKTAAVKGNATYVLYKAKVEINGAVPSKPFYVMNGKVYKDYATLKETYKGLALTDDDSQAEYEKLNIKKYENGLCYYLVPIHTANGKYTILRNNWYKLDVKSISSLGFPGTNIPEDDKTMLDLEVTIQPWTVHMNDIEL